MSPNTTSLATLLRRPLIAITDDTTVLEALALARVEHLHHLPVLHEGDLVGLVCTCDLQSATPEQSVGAVMSQPAVTLDLGATVLDAALALEKHDVGSVVLLEGSRPSGIVTRGDLLLAEPALAQVLSKTRCECCHLTRHLRRDSDGHILCIYCLEPGVDGRLIHFAAE